LAIRLVAQSKLNVIGIFGITEKAEKELMIDDDGVQYK
jgi:hypothetical protein